MSTRLLTPANLISLMRAALAPVILLLLVEGSRDALIAALVIACAAAISDFADGYMARKGGLASDFGRYVDAACDAIFSLSVFLGFLSRHWLAPSLFAAIYFAEIIVPYLGAFTKQLGMPFEIRWTARLKTNVHPATQVVAIAAALLLPDSRAVIAGACAVAVAASMIYLFDHAALAVRRARPV